MHPQDILREEGEPLWQAVALFPLRLIVWLVGSLLIVALEVLWTPFEALGGLWKRLRDDFSREEDKPVTTVADVLGLDDDD